MLGPELRHGRQKTLQRDPRPRARGRVPDARGARNPRHARDAAPARREAARHRLPRVPGRGAHALRPLDRQPAHGVADDRRREPVVRARSGRVRGHRRGGGARDPHRGARPRRHAHPVRPQHRGSGRDLRTPRFSAPVPADAGTGNGARRQAAPPGRRERRARDPERRTGRDPALLDAGRVGHDRVRHPRLPGARRVLHRLALVGRSARDELLQGRSGVGQPVHRPRQARSPARGHPLRGRAHARGALLLLRARVLPPREGRGRGAVRARGRDRARRRRARQGGSARAGGAAR